MLCFQYRQTTLFSPLGLLAERAMYFTSSPNFQLVAMLGGLHARLCHTLLVFCYLYVSRILLGTFLHLWRSDYRRPCVATIPAALDGGRCGRAYQRHLTARQQDRQNAVVLAVQHCALPQLAAVGCVVCRAVVHQTELGAVEFVQRNMAVADRGPAVHTTQN